MTAYRNKKYSAQIPVLKRKVISAESTLDRNNALFLRMNNTFIARIDDDMYMFTADQDKHLSTSGMGINNNTIVLVSVISDLKITPTTKLMNQRFLPFNKAIRECQDRGDTIVFRITVTLSVNLKGVVKLAQTHLNLVQIVTSENVRTDCPFDVADAMSTFEVVGYTLVAKSPRAINASQGEK